MKRYFEELDFQVTPIGELSLRRKYVAMLNDLEVYEVKLGEEFLMSSLFHAVEDAVSDLGLAELGGADCDVVVGGLGLGYTALAALAFPNVRAMDVIDFLAPVIEWHRTGLVPNGPLLTADRRCHFVHGDFFAMATAPEGFGAGRKFHAVLLDIDHSPRLLLDQGNAPFYTQAGLTAMAAQLHPGGVFSMWSDEPPDQDFMELLGTVFPQVRAEVVRFPNPLLDCESSSTVYIARTAAAQ